MVVVFAKYIPPAVRGRMKLWFIEPKPNVFVSGIKDSVADTVVKYLYSNCPEDSELLIFQKLNTPPYYKVWSFGNSSNNITVIDGLQLIFEKKEKE